MSTTRAYRSKIGQLPFAFRHELNHRIRDGRTGSELLNHINSSKEFKALRRRIACKSVNAQNLSDWRDTGYADWLADQRRTDHIRNLAELSQQIVEQAGGDPAAVGSRILAGNMLSCLETASPQDTEALAKALTALRKEETSARKTDLAQEALALKEQEYNLSRDKFEVQTAELFLQWFENKKAVAIAASSTSHSRKIKALRSFIRDAINED